ncbi:MAG TPA: Spy/CpxP family protein refolding chaperone, partial [Planctomycetota bacterium]|nr:Spy/CpxP family protein refolding chaperone [Planctomycetota bacterium]
VANLTAGGLVGIAVGSGITQARAGTRPEHVKLSDAMKKDLNLTDEQVEKVHAILEARRPECQRLREESRHALEAFRKGTDEEFRKVLTKEQMEKLAELRRQRAAAEAQQQNQPR